jgi:hypothetical protein
MHWKVGVEAGEPRHEVILPDTDRAFGGILPMVVWWDQLKIDIFGAHELFQRS